MSGRAERAVDVPVAGGDLRVGIWDAATPDAATALLVHGITSSHLAWAFTADRLAELRLVAPDLRGRGVSRSVTGGAGLVAHADDLAAVLDHEGIERTIVVGHSMGAFVSVVFAHRHPDRVSRLLLIDGGLPLDVPAGMPVADVISGVLGPTAARLSMRFGSVAEYLAFWHEHPAFARDWSPALERYLAYDLVDDGAGALRPATSYETVVEDVTDMNGRRALPDALDALRHPARLITAPRGLQDEPPGLYPVDYVERVLSGRPGIRHERRDGFNHYTLVMSDAGAEVVASALREEVAADAAE